MNVFSIFNREKYRLSACFERYSDDVEASMKLARSSLEKYREIVPRVITILGDIDVRDLDGRAIILLKKEMNRQNLSPPRKNHYLVVLRNILRFLKKQEHIQVYEPRNIEMFGEPRKKIEFLSMVDLQNLLESIDEDRSDTKLRLKTSIHCLFSSGCRASELLSLNRSDIDFQTGLLEVRTKGGKLQKKIFNTVALEYLARYLKQRKDSNEALFVTHKTGSPKRWQLNDLERSLRNQARKVSLKVTPHTLRRTAATFMFHQGVALPTVQKFLGHLSPQVTERYYLGDSSFSELERVHRKVMNNF